MAVANLRTHFGKQLTDAGNGIIQPPPSMLAPLSGFCLSDYTKLQSGYNIDSIRWKGTSWADLQTSATQFNFASIDHALSVIPSNCRLKLGIDFGYDTPDWLKSQYGSIHLYHNRTGGDDYYIPDFTQTGVQNAYAATHAALYNEYKNEPRIAGIIGGWPQGKFTEPPLLVGGDNRSVVSLNAACGGNAAAVIPGYWDWALTTVMGTWPDRHVEWTGHGSWQKPLTNGTFVLDWPTLRSFVLAKAQQWGPRLVLTDYGMAAADTAAAHAIGSQTLTNATDWYSWMWLVSQTYCSVGWQATLSGNGYTAPNSDIGLFMQNVRDMNGIWAEHAVLWNDQTNFNAVSAQIKANAAAQVAAGRA